MRTCERLKKHNQYHNNDNDDNVDSQFNDPAFNYFKQNDFCLIWSKQKYSDSCASDYRFCVFDIGRR